MDRQRLQRVVVVDSPTGRLGAAVTVGSLAGTIGLDADLTPRYSGVRCCWECRMRRTSWEQPAERFVDACIQLFRRLRVTNQHPTDYPDRYPIDYSDVHQGLQGAIAYHSRLRRGGRRRSVTGSTATLYSAPCREIETLTILNIPVRHLCRVQSVRWPDVMGYRRPFALPVLSLVPLALTVSICVPASWLRARVDLWSRPGRFPRLVRWRCELGDADDVVGG